MLAAFTGTFLVTAMAGFAFFLFLPSLGATIGMAILGFRRATGAFAALAGLPLTMRGIGLLVRH
jgi:hypothetical protein